MSLHPLDSRITSCCAEIIEALCTQNRDLKRELEEAYNQFELIKYQLKEARTGLVLVTEKFWSLRLKSLLLLVFSDCLDDIPISLNCPIFSLKWDSLNSR
jgi:hypothetical protein